MVGKFTHAVATDNARLVAAALKADPGVKAIFAAYDELAKGAISAIELADQLGSKKVVFPGVLVTQSYLLENQIKDIYDLRGRLPELSLANISSAGWLRSVTF